MLLAVSALILTRTVRAAVCAQDSPVVAICECGASANVCLEGMVCSSSTEECDYIKSTEVECDAFFGSSEISAALITLNSNICDVGSILQFHCVGDATQTPHTSQTSCEDAQGTWSTQYKGCGVESCTAAIATLESAAVAAGRGDCSNVKGLSSGLEMECLVDADSKTCGGMFGFVAKLSTAMGDMGMGSSGAGSQEDIKNFCSDSCITTGMEIFGRAASDSQEAINSMIEMMCVTDKDISDGSTRYCWADVNSFLGAMAEGMCSDTSKLHEYECAQGGGAWTTTAMSNSYLDQNVCGDHRCVQKGLIAIGGLDPEGEMAVMMETFADFTCLRNQNHYCMVSMMATDAPNDNSCGKCSDPQWTSTILCEHAGTCSAGNADNEDDCEDSDAEWTQTNTWTTLTPADAGWEQCKAQVGTYESLGCCVNSILKSPMMGDEGAVLQKLFVDAQITLPAACSLDAVKLGSTVTVPGMSTAQCKAFKSTILVDMATTAGVAKAHVKDLACTAAGRFRALGDSSDGAAITFNIVLPDEESAGRVSQALTNPELKKTQQKAGQNGVKLDASATGKTVAPIANPSLTGTVVTNTEEVGEADNVDDGSGHAGVSLLALLAAALVAGFSQVA